jgi:hypothetical protein
MFTTRVLGTIALATFAGSACGSSTQPDREIAIRTSATEYTRAANTTVSVAYTIVNEGTAALRITNSCGDDASPAIERRSGTRWDVYGGGGCLGIFPVGAVVVQPGATRHGTAAIADAGVYRLVVATDRGQIASASFTIR